MDLVTQTSLEALLRKNFPIFLCIKKTLCFSKSHKPPEPKH